MFRIKKFNESVVNSIDSVKSDILQILQDSFVDSGISINFKDSGAYIKDNYIKSRESIWVLIGDSSYSQNKKRMLLSDDKIDDIKRLLSWCGDYKLEIKEFKIYPDTGVHILINEKDIDSLYNLKNREIILISIQLQNVGWQGKHQLVYGGTVQNKIVQEYEFKDINMLVDFVTDSMKIFKSSDHHPDLFHWEKNKVIIYLKTHSSDSVTEKDWDVANKLDLLYKSI